MTAGIQIFNDSGYIQITESYRNMQYIGKGTIASFTDLLLPTNVLHIAFRCATSRVGVIYNGVDASTGQVRVRFATPTVGTVVTYYMFGYPTTKSGSMFEIYDGSGRLVFSDNNTYMKVLASQAGSITEANIYSGFSTSEGNTVATVATTAGLTTAVLLGSFISKLRVPVNSPAGIAIWGMAFTFNATSILAQTVFHYMTSPPADDNYWSVNLDYNFLVIDVTNL